MEKFERKVMQFIEEQKLLTSKQRVVIACSGGIDSMAMVHFFLAIQAQYDLEIIVAHVDHMLRGEVSYMDRQFVESFCKEQNVRCESISIPIPKLIAAGGNVQAICRRERYQFFEETMAKYNAHLLVTAHHMDDQLESILMHLVKSPAIQGLQGIKPKRLFASGEMIRPFLAVTKKEIEVYLQCCGGEYREDSSNEKDDYLRNRLRHHVIPHLYKEHVDVAAHALHLSLQQAEDELYLMEQAEKLFQRIVKRGKDDCFSIEMELLFGEPVALQRRLILILLDYLYNKTDTFTGYAVCSMILKFAQKQNGSATMNLPASYIAERRYNQLLFYKQTKKAVRESIMEISLNRWTELEHFRIYIGQETESLHSIENVEVYYISKEAVATQLYVRGRQHGDRIRLSGMQEPKRVSRIFIDSKVPLYQRDDWPLLVNSEQEVLAILGIRVSCKFFKHKQSNEDYILIVDSAEGLKRSSI